MKRNLLKTSLKLQLSRETLRTLAEPQLLKASGGNDTGLTCAPEGGLRCFIPGSRGTC